MNSRWSEAEARRFVGLYGERWGEALALRTYASRLLGAEPSLVLHGGGNTSVKGTATDLFGEVVPALFVKASGRDLAAIEPEGLVAVELAGLRRLGRLDDLDDLRLGAEIRRLVVDPEAPDPSIETPVHALLPAPFIDHTHADAVLALSNRPGGEEAVREALGDGVILVPYALPGLRLARASAAALAAHPEARGMVWLHHGILTWGETAQESYEGMVELVSRAEAQLAREQARGAQVPVQVAVQLPAPPALAERLLAAASVLRGLLASPTGDPDRPHRRVVLQALQEEATLAFLASPGAREIAVTPPLTTDHLIRTRPLPLWVEEPVWDDPAALRQALAGGIARWRDDYFAYLARYPMPPGVEPFPASPRVLLLPGLGAIAAGPDAREAAIARDITARTLAVKAGLLRAGIPYQGLAEEHLFAMEYRPFQERKLGRREDASLEGTVALVTGAAGAIGAGISRVLLEAGCHLAATDLAGEALDRLGGELAADFPGRVLARPLDVTDPDSVAAGFAAACRGWGGVDLVVVNAGTAHVATLEELQVEDFERLERINVHGTLLVLAEAARLLRRQGTGGDAVLVSSKNVFAPGASFGAYSATKAAAHQLARIASLELAPIGVRVNMVAPDAVFGGADRPSGLWREVGPSRMQARGLDAEGLEEYYRRRNLLQARVTPRHVGEAVLFFARRLTPTTGATLPVDGGLPEATPR